MGFRKYFLYQNADPQNKQKLNPKPLIFRIKLFLVEKPLLPNLLLKNKNWVGRGEGEAAHFA